MIRALTTCLLVLALTASPALAQFGMFGWTISNSTTNPFSNSGAIATDPANPFGGSLYLWIAGRHEPQAPGEVLTIEETRSSRSRRRPRRAEAPVQSTRTHERLSPVASPIATKP